GGRVRRGAARRKARVRPGAGAAIAGPAAAGRHRVRKRAPSPAPSLVSRVGRWLRERVAGGGAAGGGGAVDLGDGRDCGGRGALGDLGGVAADVVGAVTDGLVVGEAVGSTGAEDLDRHVGRDAGGFFCQVGVGEAGVAAV